MPDSKNVKDLVKSAVMRFVGEYWEPADVSEAAEAVLSEFPDWQLDDVCDSGVDNFKKMIAKMADLDALAEVVWDAAVAERDKRLGEDNSDACVCQTGFEPCCKHHKGEQRSDG